MTTRRKFLLGAAAVGGALVLGVALWPDGRLRRAREILGQDGAIPHLWVKITPDNIVTAIVPHSEMGQGVHTALPMMLAEELEADWDLVRVQEAPADAAYANGVLGQGFLRDELGMPSIVTGRWITQKAAEFLNLQITGGSSTIRFTGDRGMRVAGAAVKEMLIAAAAQRWGVSPGECVAKLSRVTHAASNRSATYGELAADAALLDIPAEPKLKDRKDYTIVGTPKQRFDIPGKVDGSAVYGVDVKLPEMLYAAVRKAPVWGGTYKSGNEAAAKAVRGVVAVVPLGNAVAVVADRYWRAQWALDALDPQFDGGSNAGVTSETIQAQFKSALDANDSSTDFEQGDAASAIGGAARVIEAEYRVPYLAHATMEPMNATAWVHDGKLELWVGTQDPLGTVAVAADGGGFSMDDVIFHHVAMGGGFGRRAATVLSAEGSLCNHVTEAVALAKLMSPRPVKLIYSREQDIAQDYYRPAVTSRFRAGLNATGTPTSWINTYVRKDLPADAAHIPYGIADQTIAYVDSTTHVPYGPWRSVAHTQHAFFTESFVDELAEAAGQDPFEYRRALLAEQPRYKRVLELAAEKAGWGTPLAPGRGRGIALQKSFNSIVAEVAEVTVGADGKVKVDRIVAAVDCGDVINPDTVEAQIQGGVIFGLSAALYGEIRIADGAAVELNFHDYPMVTLADAPRVEVHVIRSGEALGGLGEPGTPCVAPAVSNAIFSATGQRIRELPIKNHQLKPRGLQASL